MTHLSKYFINHREKSTQNMCLFHTLNQVFGLKLVEIDQKSHTYILINKLETAEGASPIK